MTTRFARSGQQLRINNRSGEKIAGDIRKFEDLGVGYVVVDFARHSQNLEDMLGHLEDMTTEVWPQRVAPESCRGLPGETGDRIKSPPAPSAAHVAADLGHEPLYAGNVAEGLGGFQVVLQVVEGLLVISQLVMDDSPVAQFVPGLGLD